jgi:hypothetical protein
MDIVEFLIRQRKQQRIDQKSLLHRLKITAVTMSRYENKSRPMPLIIVEKYADEMGFELKLIAKTNTLNNGK